MLWVVRGNYLLYWNAPHPVYITQNPALVAQTKHDYHLSHPSLPARFCTYEALLIQEETLKEKSKRRTLLSDYADDTGTDNNKINNHKRINKFIFDWIKNYIKLPSNTAVFAKIKDDPVLIWEEFRIICGYEKEEYLKLTERESNFGGDENRELREKLWIAYQALKKHLDDNKLMYAPFTELTGKYPALVVDEAQDFSLLQLISLLFASINCNTRFFYDRNQTLKDRMVNKIEYLNKQYFKKFGEEKSIKDKFIKEVKLKKHFRCSKAVCDLANRVIDIENIIGADPEQNLIGHSGKAGAVQWVQDNSDNPDNRDEYNLNLMSVDDFDQLKALKLAQHPYLIKDNKGTYKIWGYKNGQWALTDLGQDFTPQEEWKWNDTKDKEVLIAPGTNIFNTLKKGHNPDNKEKLASLMRASPTEFAIVTLPEFEAEARGRFGTKMVFNSESIKGMQYKHIVLYRVFDGAVNIDELKKANSEIAELEKKARREEANQSTAPNDDESKKDGTLIPEHYLEELRKRNRQTDKEVKCDPYWRDLYTSITRAENSVILFQDFEKKHTAKHEAKAHSYEKVTTFLRDKEKISNQLDLAQIPVTTNTPEKCLDLANELVRKDLMEQARDMYALYLRLSNPSQTFTEQEIDAKFREQYKQAFAASQKSAAKKLDKVDRSTKNAGDKSKDVDDKSKDDDEKKSEDNQNKNNKNNTRKKSTGNANVGGNKIPDTAPVLNTTTTMTTSTTTTSTTTTTKATPVTVAQNQIQADKNKNYVTGLCKELTTDKLKALFATGSDKCLGYLFGFKFLYNNKTQNLISHFCEDPKSKTFQIFFNFIYKKENCAILFPDNLHKQSEDIKNGIEEFFNNKKCEKIITSSSFITTLLNTFDVALKKPNLELAEFLFKKCSKKLANAEKNKLLLAAAEAGSSCIVKELIALKADVNYKETWTALHLAANKGHKDIVKLLLDANAKVDIQCDENVTPLLAAAQEGQENHIEIVKLLIDHKADVNLKTTDGCTALHNAAYKGNKKIISLLLENNAIVDETDRFNTTPLIMATEQGHFDAVNLLIDKQANVNHLCRELTPLSLAAKKGFENIVESLLKAPNIDITNITETLDLAKQAGYPEIVTLLEKHQAQLTSNKNNISSSSNEVVVSTFSGALFNVNNNKQTNTNELESSSKKIDFQDI